MRNPYLSLEELNNLQVKIEEGRIISNEPTITYQNDGRYVRIEVTGENGSNSDEKEYEVETEEWTWIELIVKDTNGEELGSTCLYIGDPVKASKPKPNLPSMSRRLSKRSDSTTAKR
ncbi:MAG: hypothetical protein AAFY71_19630 [Bacteroidota bacterium]